MSLEAKREVPPFSEVEQRNTKLVPQFYHGLGEALAIGSAYLGNRLESERATAAELTQAWQRVCEPVDGPQSQRNGTPSV